MSRVKRTNNITAPNILGNLGNISLIQPFQISQDWYVVNIDITLPVGLWWEHDFLDKVAPLADADISLPAVPNVYLDAKVLLSE